jgi:hypothetical protein
MSVLNSIRSSYICDIYKVQQWNFHFKSGAKVVALCARTAIYDFILCTVGSTTSNPPKMSWALYSKDDFNHAG